MLTPDKLREIQEYWQGIVDTPYGYSKLPYAIIDITQLLAHIEAQAQALHVSFRPTQICNVSSSWKE